MKKLLIKNAKALVQVREEDNCPEKVPGKEMAKLPMMEDAWLAVEDGEIVDYGKMEDWPGITDWRDLEVIDAEGCFVLPSFVDPHTHIVYATSREDEFVDRIKGLSYQEIAKRGGGILNSAKKMQEASEESLFESAKKRLDHVMKLGTGAVEIKSGYGLTVDSELKMLRVIKRLKEEHPLPIKATFLGAHAYPAEFKDNHQGYIDLITKEMIPQVAEEGLAEYIDAFLETDYFSNEETAQILEAGEQHGLRPKVHVNQFTSIGGVETCLKYNALSVDHLEVMDKKDYEVLQGTGCMPTILPSCSFFINIPYAPAREMMERGLPIALATDFNPGSTPSGNIPLVLALACIKCRMTPEEAINAATLNAAYAMELQQSHGSITRGKRASLIITRPMSSLNYLPYSFGENLVKQVIVNGKVVR